MSKKKNTGGGGPQWNAGPRGRRSSSGFEMVCSNCQSDNVTSKAPRDGFRDWHCNACSNDWIEPV